MISQDLKPFSPFSYLRLLAFIPVIAWFWAGETLHRMEMQQALGDPSSLLKQVCQSPVLQSCDVYAVISFVHVLALGIVFFVLYLMMLTSTLPKWPQKWQEYIVKRAAFFGGMGLLLTLLLVIARGVVTTLTVWFIPLVWWNAGSIAVQLAAVIGLLALVRLPPHLIAAWRLFSTHTTRRTGKPVSRAECPALWILIDAACIELGVDSPRHLVLGVFPDCRLTFGKMVIDPADTIIEGTTLYLGSTLLTSLDDLQLKKLIAHAMLRSRGKFGHWLPAAEDWIESSEGFLNESKIRRARKKLSAAADPAILCWDGWLVMLKQMIHLYRDEHSFAQSWGIEQDIAVQTAESRALLDVAALTYKTDVFPLFIVKLTAGVNVPSVQLWFANAFSKRRGVAAEVNTSLPTNKLLLDELVLLEKEWLIKTAQASTPTDCWELRVA